jgi:hypothetical protein
MNVQRRCLLTGVSAGAQKFFGSRFMDIQRTCLLKGVSAGARVMGLRVVVCIKFD